MIRQLRAFGWLRWRLLLNGLKGARRRDSIEQVSRILALVAPALVMALSFGSVVALAVGGVALGVMLAGQSPHADIGVMAMRIALGLQLVLVVFLPLGLGAQSSSRFARLLLLPIPRRLLHFTETGSGIADPWVFAIVPGLLLLPMGLLYGGALGTAGVALVASLGLLAVVLSAGALVTFLVAWLMRDRRRAELLTLVFVLLLSLGGLLPYLAASDAPRRSRASRDRDTPRPEVTVATIDNALPRWTRVVPTEMYALSVSTAARGDLAAGGLWAAGLWIQAAALFFGGGWVYGRVLDAGASQARRRLFTSIARRWQVPLVSAEASAVASAQFRTAIASVRGRLAVLMPGPMTGLLAAMLTRQPDDIEWMSRIPDYSHFVYGAGLVLVIYSLLPITMNQLASDRAGLTLQLLLPIGARDLLVGKAVGTLSLFLASAALTLLITVVTMGGGVLPFAAVTLAGVATFVVLVPAATAVSAVLPVNADLSRTGSGGNPHPAAMLGGMVLVGLAAAPVVGVLLVAGRWGDAAMVAGATGSLAVALLLALAALGPVARLVEARSENLHLTTR
jgi:hypothetical protein